ncbi:RCC1/BLIP-II, partial [Rozella allomycis CSF55]
GSNSFGQCGTNDTVDYTRFKKVLTINEKILKISHGGYHTFLITESKSVYGCGGNDKGQLGITGLKENLLQFTLLENVKADDIACGWDHSILLLDGRVFVTGSNSFHQLGVEKVKRLDTWTDLSIPESISKISCGLRHSMALTTEGSVYVWGNNSHYKCFTWEKHVIVPTKISLDAYLDADEIVVDMALGQHHSCLLTSKMKCLLAGRNKFGECCGLAPNQDVFSCVIPNCLKVFCGWNTTIFYCIDKKVYGTGRNDYFQLAIDEPQQVNQLVPMLEDVDCISVGSEHCLFLREAKAFAFGWNEHGNLGVEHQNRDIFRVVIGNACLVSAGYGNSFVVVLDS